MSLKNAIVVLKTKSKTKYEYRVSLCSEVEKIFIRENKKPKKIIDWNEKELINYFSLSNVFLCQEEAINHANNLAHKINKEELYESLYGHCSVYYVEVEKHFPEIVDLNVG